MEKHAHVEHKNGTNEGAVKTQLISLQTELAGLSKELLLLRENVPKEIDEMLSEQTEQLITDHAKSLEENDRNEFASKLRNMSHGQHKSKVGLSSLTKQPNSSSFLLNELLKRLENSKKEVQLVSAEIPKRIVSMREVRNFLDQDLPKEPAPYEQFLMEEGIFLHFLFF